MRINTIIEDIGSYQKNLDLSIEPDANPPRLNPNKRLYGRFPRNEGLDLSFGRRNCKDDGAGEKLESILEFIKYLANKNNIWNLKKLLDSDFVSARGTIRKIAESAYEEGMREKDDYGFKLIAVQQHGIIFLLRIEKYQSPGLLHLHNGLKFEQYMTLKDDGEPFDKHEPISKNTVKRVFRMKIKDVSSSLGLFYAAEIDAIDENDDSVELKVLNGGAFTRNWWTQSSLRTFLQTYLAKTNKLVFGKRTNKFVVSVDVVDRNAILKSSRKSWKMVDCMERLHSLLTDIKERMSDGKAMIVTCTTNVPQYESCNPDDYNLVPQEFLSLFELEDPEDVEVRVPHNPENEEILDIEEVVPEGQGATDGSRVPNCLQDLSNIDAEGVQREITKKANTDCRSSMRYHSMTAAFSFKSSAIGFFFNILIIQATYTQ